MTAKRLKQLLLAILLLIAAYIWWGNIALLFPSGADHEQPSQTDTPPVSDPSVLPGIAYREPKVNPFLHAVPAAESERIGHDLAPNGPARLPETLQLVGVLCLGPGSQAVLQVDPQTTKTFTLGDRLGEWTLMEISDDAVIFGAGRARDTLHLVGAVPIDEQ